MSAGLLVLVAWLDALAGDPRWLPHPVRAIGATIAACEQTIRRTCRSPMALRLAGVVLALFLPMLVYIVAMWTLTVAAVLWPFLALVLSVLLAWTTVAARDLWDHVRAVSDALAAGELDLARQALSLIVGRDTQSLDEPQIVRATIETLAESTADGIVAPLLHLAIGGPALALAYKTVNTLDSMVGHREEPYRDLGWASARLDDALNWVPSRLTAFAIGLAAGWVRGGSEPVLGSWRTTLRDGGNHPSPNSGRPEAAMAGALAVQLGGVNWYDGVPHERPSLGDAVRPLDLQTLDEAMRVMAATSLIVLALAVLVMRVWTGSWW
ncbi:MAG: adenosylcobinamide-phosphate synthase CbiB [Nitrospiraceae bacterium]